VTLDSVRADQFSWDRSASQVRRGVKHLTARVQREHLLNLAAQVFIALAFLRQEMLSANDQDS
jgi:hypothetical protein